MKNKFYDMVPRNSGGTIKTTRSTKVLKPEIEERAVSAEKPERPEKLVSTSSRSAITNKILGSKEKDKEKDRSFFEKLESNSEFRQKTEKVAGRINAERANERVAEKAAERIAEKLTEIRRPKAVGHKKSRKFYYYAGFTLCLVIIIFSLSTFFISAKVFITPKKVDVSVNGKFTAYRNPKTNSLGFDLMTITDTKYESAPAVVTSNKETKAQGTVTILNNYSPASQTLVAGTRLQSKNGLIYKLTKTVVVPGTTKTGSTVKPGSLVVTVVAENTGSKYNMLISDLNGDFTIPGFATNKDKFAKIYGRQKTDITGGGGSKELRPSTADEAKARESLKKQLEISLKQKISEQIPNNFIAFGNSYTFNYEKADYKTTENNMVMVGEKGSVQVPIFNRDLFVKKVAGEKLNDLFNDGQYQYTDLGTLAFKFVSDPKLISTDQSITFSLNGAFIARSIIDTKQMAKILAGVNKNSITSVTSGLSYIGKISMELRPSWIKKLPYDVEKIEIIIEDK